MAKNRESIQREIARLDGEINNLIANTELPKLDIRPFPTGTWLFAFLCFGWWLFGSLIPYVNQYHRQTAMWGLYLGVVMVIVAIISTFSWMIRGRGYKHQSSSYMENSRKARELQEKRRELQMDLRSLSEDDR